MVRLILVVAVVMALAMTKMPTFSHPHSKVVPQPLPAWEQIDAKLQALATEKQITTEAEPQRLPDGRSVPTL